MKEFKLQGYVSVFFKDTVKANTLEEALEKLNVKEITVSEVAQSIESVDSGTYVLVTENATCDGKSIATDVVKTAAENANIEILY